MRRGLSGGLYKPLNKEGIQKIHKTVLKVFAEVGIQVNHKQAFEMFKKARHSSQCAGSWQ
jgi:trimethylamine:corrinoid methyltransferase-like protein